MNRHLGRFTIPTDLVAKKDSLVTRIMGQCAVLQAEHDYARDVFAYMAISDRFPEVALGEIIPEYVWHVSADGWIEPSLVTWR
jgi:hypothetical protein